MSDLVDLSSGSVTAELYARAHPIAAVGSVGQVVGDVIVVRNGVAVTLHVGDAVYKNDAVLTGSGSSISIVFPDGTALNLVANTMMVMNEYSYDPRVTSNVALITLVGGSFSFVAGRVAHAGELKIETPVATMDIHGGAGSVHEQVATTSTNLGQGGYSFSHGQYDLIDQTGSVIATAPESGLVTFVTLGESDLPPTVSTAPMTNSEVFQILNLFNTSPLSGAGGDLDIQLIPQVIHDNSAAPVSINGSGTLFAGLTTVTGAVAITVTTPVITGTANGATVSQTSAATAAVLDAAPTVTTPVITGTAQEGQTLTASASAGQSDNAVSYQWMENSGSGGSYQNIAGATAATYLVKEADEGFKIEVVATATNDNGATVSQTSAATAAVLDAAPTVTTPVITGTAQEGQTLTASASAGQSDNAVSYQWMENSGSGGSYQNIAGATAATYPGQGGRRGFQDRGRGDHHQRQRRRRVADQRRYRRGPGCGADRDHAGHHRHGAGRSDADRFGKRRAERQCRQLSVDGE